MSPEPLTPSIAPISSTPAGWPCVDTGLFMAHVGPVMTVHVDDRLTEASFERHLGELGRAIDARQSRVGVVYAVPELRSMDAVRRRKLAGVLSARKESIRRHTAAFALVTTSREVRAAVDAVFWLARPPHPVTVGGRARRGLLVRGPLRRRRGSARPRGRAAAAPGAAPRRAAALSGSATCAASCALSPRRASPSAGSPARG